MELWWINSSLTETCDIFGNIYGHPECKDGQFVELPMLRADFTTGIVETDDCFVKLGTAMSLEQVFERLNQQKKGGE